MLTSARGLLYTVTLNCGHRRRVRQEPSLKMACVECRKTRDVVKTRISRTSY